MLDSKVVKPATITYSQSSCRVQRARVDVRIVLLLLLRQSIAHLNDVQFAVRLVVTKPQPSLSTIAFSYSMRSMKTDLTYAGQDLILQNREPGLAAADPRA